METRPDNTYSLCHSGMKDLEWITSPPCQTALPPPFISTLLHSPVKWKPDECWSLFKSWKSLVHKWNSGPRIPERWGISRKFCLIYFVFRRNFPTIPHPTMRKNKKSYYSQSLFFGGNTALNNGWIQWRLTDWLHGGFLHFNLISSWSVTVEMWWFCLLSNFGWGRVCLHVGSYLWIRTELTNARVCVCVYTVDRAEYTPNHKQIKAYVSLFHHDVEDVSQKYSGNEFCHFIELTSRTEEQGW